LLSSFAKLFGKCLCKHICFPFLSHKTTPPFQPLKRGEGRGKIFINYKLPKSFFKWQKKSDKPEWPEMPEMKEKPEWPEMPEMPDKPEWPGKPEMPEIPEIPNMPEMPEQPENPTMPVSPL
jgi:hypothetical protein